MLRAPIKLLPSREELLRLFAYDPESGTLTWRANPKFHGKPVGKCGTITARGYLHVGIRQNGKPTYYLAHRLIWKMVTGDEPVFQIDHIDGDRLHNAWSNLRAATNGQNVWNSKLRRDNKTGFKGVHFKGRKYRAAIKDGSRIRHLGCFDTAEEAALAWEREASKQRGQYFRLS